MARKTEMKELHELLIERQSIEELKRKAYKTYPNRRQFFSQEWIDYCKEVVRRNHPDSPGYGIIWD